MPRKKAVKTVTFAEDNIFIEPEKNETDKIVSESVVETISDTGHEHCNTELQDTNDNLTHVVVQLPISAEHIEDILSQDDMCDPLEYNPKLSEPTAYMPVNFFSSKNDEVVTDNVVDINTNTSTNTENNTAIDIHDDTSTIHSHSDIQNKPCNNNKNAICFWCCHSVEHNQFGMPIRYDSVHDNFTFFGTFCSLECVSAYNFSVHLGSDRAWDIQSWIQMLGRNYGIKEPIRPAPSRYTLQMFDGSLTIEEFRKVHKNYTKSVMVNIPPLVSIKPQIETLNTSFFTVDTTKDVNNTTDNAKKTLKRKIPTTESKKTLESKLNLSYTSLSGIIETM